MKGDRNDFVFSLDLNKKYNFCDSEHCFTIVGDICNGLAFGHTKIDKFDFCFVGGSLNHGISKSSPSFKTNNELNNGKERFETKDLVVYQAIINENK